MHFFNYFKILQQLTLTTVFIFLLISDAACEEVKVRAAAHDGYGRIVFNWSKPVPYEVSTFGSQLVVRFGSFVEPELSGVVGNLSRYLSSAAVGADRKSVVFTMKEDFEASGFDMGSSVVIDITDAIQANNSSRRIKAETQATQKIKPKKSLNTQLVKLRTGIHDDYTRVVFDWPKKISYQFDRNGEIATIKFPDNVQFETALSKRGLPRLISSYNSEFLPNETIVTFGIPNLSRVRHFFSGTKVVVDVIKPDKKSPVTSVRSLPVKKVKVETDAIEQVNKKPTDANKKQEKSTKLSKPRILNPPLKTKKNDTSEGLESKLAGISGVEIIQAKPSVSSKEKNSNLTTTNEIKDLISIQFDWNQPVAAAVFRRHGYLWIVFDKNTKVNLSALKATAGNIFRKIEQIPYEGATLLRVITVSGVNPTLKRDGLAWILEFKQQPINPAKSILITPQPTSPVGSRLFIPITEPGRAIPFTDPEIGDSLVVIPVIPLGHGVSKQYNFPQARILPSSQGVIIKPRADDLRISSLPQGVEMTSSSGLKISAVAPALAADTKLENSMVIRSLSRLFDLDKWRKAKIDTFEQNKWKYQMAAAGAKSSSKEAARLDMARFYFANGFGPEALGVLRVIQDESPKIIESPEFRGLRGAINVLMARFDDARSDLEHESLKDNDEALFWRASLRAFEGDLFGAAANLRRMAAITRPYPNALKIPLSTLIAEAAIELGDIKQAKRYLESLMASKLTPAEKSKIQFVEGRMLELSGNFEEAVNKWKEVETGPHPPSRAKAALARTELLLDQDLIDKYDAISELEKLRFAWRGDAFEFDVLRRLGDLYISVGDYRNGLRTMRQAATHFRDYKEAPEVTQLMIDTFGELYLENKADDLAPITAIALYDEFKELTPSGDKGAEMIRRLADRLVAVDLLDRAAELLFEQVEFRLNGLEKARVGTQLSLIHLLGNEFEETIRVLDETNFNNLPSKLVDQRRHLRSRSLMGQGRIDDALALLEEDKSLDADLLRLEMYWNDQDWVPASKTLNRILRAYETKPNKPLNELQAQTILNMGVALTLSGNERGIDRLNRNYGSAMDETRFGDAFRLIASPNTLGLISYPSIAGKVKDVENFQTFLSAYQERLKKGKLSEIN